MMKNMMVAAGTIALMLGATAAAQAATMAFKAALSGAQETPPTKSPGTGSLTATYDPTTKMLTWTVTYSGLTGPATMSHFHGPAGPGKAAGVEVPAPVSASPIKGSATLTDSQAKDLMAGNMYFNIHTAANKAGEIRGQIVK